MQEQATIVPDLEEISAKLAEKKKITFIEEPERSARSLLPHAPVTDLHRGAPDWNFDRFSKTEYQITIPYRGTSAIEDSQAELAQLTPELLNRDEFPQFYRHVYMLQRFASPETVAQYLPTIRERAKAITAKFAASEYPNAPLSKEEWEENMYILSMACLERCEDDLEVRISQEQVKSLYHDALTSHTRSLRYALEFDRRNRAAGESIGVAQSITPLLAAELIHPTEGNETRVNDLLRWCYADSQILPKLLIFALKKTQTADEGIAIVNRLAPFMRLEKMRKTLRAYADVSEDFRPRFHEIFTYMSLDKGEEIAINLGRDVYDRTDFVHYPPNEELLTFDSELLTKLCQNAERVLDVGCGTGRHMEHVAGTTTANVSGFDLVPEHIHQIQEKHPDFDVRQGDWFDIPFPNKQFDIAYCLGRSFTHNTTLEDAVDCLNEMKRVITDNGMILIDLPDPSQGEYLDYVDETVKRTQEKGYQAVLGMINDSPNQRNYFDRLALPEAAFVAVAKLAGLKAEKIAEKEYHGLSGRENVNTYWKLTKILPEPMHGTIVYSLTARGSANDLWLKLNSKLHMRNKS